MLDEGLPKLHLHGREEWREPSPFLFGKSG
jgi:hypothetical protein